MYLIRVKIPRNCWISRITNEYKGMSLKVYSYVKVGEETLINAHLYRSVNNIVEELMQLPCVKNVIVINKTKDLYTIRVMCSCPLSKMFSKAMIIPPVPFEVRDGVAYWDLSSLEDDAVFDEFRRGAKEAGGAVRIVKRKNNGLTDRQREILKVAISEGYYDFPRRITLSQLAEKLGVSKATLSEMLMKIESKIIKKYFE